jgi:hypothetical protein
LNAEGTVSVPTVFWATTAGYFGNNFLPARAGELVRTFMISSASGLESSYVLATALSERVADAVALVVISAVVLLILPAQLVEQLLIDFAAPELVLQPVQHEIGRFAGVFEIRLFLFGSGRLVVVVCLIAWLLRLGVGGPAAPLRRPVSVTGRRRDSAATLGAPRVVPRFSRLR